MTHGAAMQNQQMTWIERLRQLRRDRAKRTEQACLAEFEAAMNAKLEAAAQLHYCLQRHEATTNDVPSGSVEASRLVQVVHRQNWADRQLQRARFELARAEHCGRLKQAAADEAARHALRQSIQYEKVVEWRKSM